MNGLDYAIVVLVSIGAFYGLLRGALRMVTSAVSLVAAICFASLYYEQAAAIVHAEFGGSPAVDAVGAYVALFAVAFAVIELVGTSIIRLLHAAHLGWADRLLGSALGAAVAGLLAGLAVMMLTALMPANATILEQSHLAPKVLVYNRELVRYVPDEIKEAYESKRSQLMRYWIETESKSGQQHASPEAPATPTASK
jgi:membrane protein required for colicin V production